MPKPLTPMDADSIWSVEVRGESIWVVFGRLIDPHSANLASRRFLELLEDGPAHLVFDTREVEAYSSKARQVWQRSLWPSRAKIRSLSVLSHSQLTRMGAMMFAAFLGLECHVVREPAELPAHLRL